MPHTPPPGSPPIDAAVLDSLRELGGEDDPGLLLELIGSS